VQHFRELKVWRKSHLLTLVTYAATTAFPTETLYGLTGQVRYSKRDLPKKESSEAYANFLCTEALGNDHPTVADS
jgi:hypothetical protein